VTDFPDNILSVCLSTFPGGLAGAIGFVWLPTVLVSSLILPDLDGLPPNVLAVCFSTFSADFSTWLRGLARGTGFVSWSIFSTVKLALCGGVVGLLITALVVCFSIFSLSLAGGTGFGSRWSTALF
jgi:hypothetical protein